MESSINASFKPNHILFLVGFLSLISCTEELGRIDMKHNPVGEVQVFLEEGDEVELWTEVDMEYVDRPSFMYDFEVLKGQMVLNKGGIDPLTSVKVKKEVLKDVEGKKHYSLVGQLPGVFKPVTDTVYTFRAVFLQNPIPNFHTNQLDLVFVRKMSFNIFD